MRLGRELVLRRGMNMDVQDGQGSEDSEDVVRSGSSEDNDVVSMFSKNMKGQQFAYEAGGKNPIERANRRTNRRLDKDHAESFSWLLKYDYIVKHTNPEDIDLITFMSDRHKGLVDIIQACWPNVRVRHCARHVYANFRKTFPRLQLRKLFWAVSRAANTIDFEQVMNDVRVANENAHR
ncbi:hypothetical protein Pint_10731 [Pistacia integerrima]|uniref:Uncharacterized protein n=1 Tax=Pistacia integerrima TaxID=434235 RepID=A0ACC0XGN0_9ROSI|nr:hypothetical protein Pint_10731 [Pistacia integerrima]